MKLWEKNTGSSAEVERFTVGNDREFDLLLAPFDVLGSIAHAKMLTSVGLLTKPEAEAIVNELKNIYSQIDTGAFRIQAGVEDVHSEIEMRLTERLGDTGKKIHSARSRNDQVLVDIKLFFRHSITELVHAIQPFFELLQKQSEKYKDVLLPGYTHLQLAMPSSFGLWFGAYAESLVDDMVSLKAAFDVADRNPLGSAAGYGSSFPIDRKMTTKLLGFGNLNYNVVYAQMTRGRTERVIAMALANVADTLSRLSMDACLYLNQNFDFISFPAELTTGSSIMPHKKNPDVFELIRAYCNQVKSLPNEIMLMTTNLPSGYHRDLQLLKQHLFPAFQIIQDCITMAGMMLSQIEIKKDLLQDEKYKYLFSVEEVNKLVAGGMPFRDAYKKIGLDIESGKFTPGTTLHHTHQGSMGDLCNEEIKRNMDNIVKSFSFARVQAALAELLK